MTKRSRQLLWSDVEAFRGWQCSACGWVRPVPRRAKRKTRLGARLTAFDVHCASNADTFALGINNRGAVVGYIGYTDPMSEAHAARGFKRDANGVFECPIDDPNTAPPNLYTVATGINDSGVIGGFYG